MFIYSSDNIYLKSNYNQGEWICIVIEIQQVSCQYVGEFSWKIFGG